MGFIHLHFLILDVKIYDIEKGVGIDERELSWSELPPIPSWVEEELLEAGGTCDGKPNIRVVSGLDPNLKEFVGGRWWLKYAFREHVTNEYYLWTKPDNSQRILSKKEGEVLIKSKNKVGIIVPMVDRQVIEHGIPRYFVEYYKPPQLFGLPEDWESQRYMEDEDTGLLMDLMGEYPSEGAYETAFCLEKAVEEDGVVVRTEFQPLDEVAVEFIKFRIQEAKNKTAVQQHAEMREHVEDEYLKHKKELKEGIKDIIADRIDRLIE